MDTVSPYQRHRAEHLSRSAAAAAHASYYAHPSLHLHTYLGRGNAARQNYPIEDIPAEDDRDRNAPGGETGPMNDAYIPPPPSIDPAPKVPQGPTGGGTEGTKEELGGKEDAGAPSGLDKGALEKGGEAGGTRTSPGPTAEEVHKWRSENGWDGPSVQKGTALEWGEKPGGEKGLNVQRMEPHLQLMCGPLLAYYTVKNDIWYGAVMIVTRDAGSNLSTPPTLSLSFHPYTPPTPDLPRLAEPEVQLLEPTKIKSERIHQYHSHDDTFSFYRFMLEVPLQRIEMVVSYGLNGGEGIEFVVPKLGQNLRWAAHSCNGFSSGVNPDEFKGDYESGYDPVWEDMILRHQQRPFHCMVGGGDQIYCDPITREPELQDWINAPNAEAKINTPLTDEVRYAVDRFYFNHYCKIFRSNAFGRANSTIPMVNMLDDHDLIDGFGTYDDETQNGAVFKHVGSRGYFWFCLFQLFTTDNHDGANPTPGTHPIKSMIIGEMGPWIPQPSHSLMVYLGPKVAMLALDCRAERKLTRIVTPETYAKTFAEVRKYKGIEQLVILLGVPIAYPRMSFLEHFLDLKYNPLNVLARHNAMGLGGMVNKFDQSSELLDDLNDHWCANTHKPERNWLVLECQKLALEMHARITFLSGDVHLAAVGCLFTQAKKLHKAIPAEEDHRYMLNVITSAIVNTPPPPGAAAMVAMLGGNKHRTLHGDNTDEVMIPLFVEDTDGTPMKRKFVQPRRNYASVEYLEESGDLVFDFRVEKVQGGGDTKSYPIKAPPPRWTRGAPAHA